jgi:hypothetical protein
MADDIMFVSADDQTGAGCGRFLSALLRSFQTGAKHSAMGDSLC